MGMRPTACVLSCFCAHRLHADDFHRHWCVVFPPLDSDFFQCCLFYPCCATTPSRVAPTSPGGGWGLRAPPPPSPRPSSTWSTSCGRWRAKGRPSPSSSGAERPQSVPRPVSWRDVMAQTIQSKNITIWIPPLFRFIFVIFVLKGWIS